MVSKEVHRNTLILEEIYVVRDRERFIDKDIVIGLSLNFCNRLGIYLSIYLSSNYKLGLVL
jgi:hypothetical protein